MWIHRNSKQLNVSIYRWAFYGNVVVHVNSLLNILKQSLYIPCYGFIKQAELFQGNLKCRLFMLVTTQVVHPGSFTKLYAIYIKNQECQCNETETFIYLFIYGSFCIWQLQMLWAKAAEKGHLCACSLYSGVAAVNFPWNLKKHCLQIVAWLYTEYRVLLRHFKS